MPAGYTHYCFGKDVYKHLDDQNIKDLLLRNENCFLIGLHGPDIFFYERWNKIARKMHQEKANTFFEKAQDIIQSEAQLAYILGFICHYLLDSQMHPYIKRMIKNTNMDHFEIESDYDRLLLKRNHQDPLHKEIYEHIRFKEKEICTSHNKDFLNSLSQPQSVIDYFKEKTRFEITLDTPKKIMKYLNLTDTKIFSVLNSDTNPILAQFDKVFGNSTANMPNTTFDDYENWAMKIILERYNGDLKLLEQDVRSKFSSRSGATKRMKKFETVYHAMTSASTSENPIEKIRNLLL